MVKSDVDKIQLLGEGTFGAVYLCKTPTFGLAAAKIAKVNSAFEAQAQSSAECWSKACLHVC